MTVCYTIKATYYTGVSGNASMNKPTVKAKARGFQVWGQTGLKGKFQIKPCF